MTATQDDMIAELQNANAALQARLDAALTQRTSDYDERIEHQAATIDVLKAMSASPGDPQPVFDLIVRQARDCCWMWRRWYYSNTTEIRFICVPAMAARRCPGPPRGKLTRARWPRTPDRGSLTCRAILDGAIIHIRDMTPSLAYPRLVRNLGTNRMSRSH